MARALLILNLALCALAAFSHSAQSLEVVNTEEIPFTDENNALSSAETFSLTATLDNDVESCVWAHNEPMNEGHGGEHDIVCTGSPESNGQQCDEDPRIRLTTSGPKCVIEVANSNPEDTGRWQLSAIALGSSGDIQSANVDFTTYTYNMSYVETVDQEQNEVHQWTTTYNGTDQTSWERVEFTGLAYGGRPNPSFKWYMEDNYNYDLADETQIFRISEGKISTDDLYGFIENFASAISFAIDEEFMQFLMGQGVDIEPADGEINFTLNFEVTQGPENIRQTVRIDFSITLY